MTSPITTHVLDTSLGRPAAGVSVMLERLTKSEWQPIGKGTTDLDGRLRDLMPAGSLTVGKYRLTFAVEKYLKRLRVKSFYPSITIEFSVAAPTEHYHVPLLLSPFGYSTYRGS